MNGPVSKRLWVYFVAMVPLTALVVGTWWFYDKRSNKNEEEDPEETDKRMRELDNRVLERMRRRTGVRVRTGDFQSVA